MFEVEVEASKRAFCEGKSLNTIFNFFIPIYIVWYMYSKV